jgi:hypothetical protein
VSYSATLGEGHVAFIRTPEGLDVTVCDRLELGLRQQQRVRAIGGMSVGQSRPPVLATFDRLYEPNSIRYLIAAEDLEIEARWEQLGSAFWMDARAPSLLPDEDIVSVFREARAGRVLVGGRPVGGSPFPDSRWVPKLGRTFSSCHAALGEVRIRARLLS